MDDNLKNWSNIFDKYFWRIESSQLWLVIWISNWPHCYFLVKYLKLVETKANLVIINFLLGENPAHRKKGQDMKRNKEYVNNSERAIQIWQILIKQATKKKMSIVCKIEYRWKSLPQKCYARVIFSSLIFFSKAVFENFDQSKEASYKMFPSFHSLH